jgi:hypothetical protein
MKHKCLAAIGAILAAMLLGCGGSAPVSQPAEPSIEQMSLATPIGKVSVPVDVRYQPSGPPLRDQPMTLQLAFVPRVAGQNLRVEFPPSDSVTIESGIAGVVQQKADAASAYRRNIVVTPRQSDGGEVRVLVSMDVEGGRYFGIYTVALGGEPAHESARKQ